MKWPRGSDGWLNRDAGAATTAAAIAIIGHVGFPENRGSWSGSLSFLPAAATACLLLARHAHIRAGLRQAKASGLAALGLLSFTVLAASLGVGKHLSKGRDVTLTPCNDAPYDIAVAIRYQPRKTAAPHTEGYWTIPSGQCGSITRNFLRQQPSFSIFAARADELHAWLNGGDSVWTLDSRETLTWAHAAPVADSATITRPTEFMTAAWDSAQTVCITSRSRNASTDARDWVAAVDCERGAVTRHEAPFLRVPFDFKRGDQYTVAFGRGGRNATLSWCNLAPYNARLVLYHQSKPREWRREAADMSAGECRDFTRNFQNTSARIFYYAEANGELARWHRTRYGFPINSSYEGHDAWVCVTSDTTAAVWHDQSHTTACATGEVLRGLTAAEFAEADSLIGYNADYTLAPYSTIIDPATGEVIPDLKSAPGEMRALSSAIGRRREFFDRYHGKVFPFLLGIMIEDTEPDPFTAAQLRGVRVAGTVGTTPFNVPIPFQPGDVITSFHGYPVFDASDLQAALDTFAWTKGVMKQYTALGYRNGQLMKWQGVFYFNEAAFPRSDYERRKAREWGTASGWSLARFFGGSPIERSCARAMDRETCIWLAQQEFWRLRQMYGSEYDRANMQASIIQGLVVFAAGGAALRTGKALLRLLGVEVSTAATVAADVALATALSATEAATWAANDIPPGVDPDEIESRIAAMAETGAKWGFAAAIIAPAVPAGRAAHAAR